MLGTGLLMTYMASVTAGVAEKFGAKFLAMCMICDLAKGPLGFKIT